MNVEAEVIKPQGMKLNAVHAEYARFTPAEIEAKAKAKLQERINAGQARALAALKRIEAEVPVDRVVKANSPAFVVERDDAQLVARVDGKQFRFHEHALGQLAERAGFPRKYLGELRASDWGRELIARNLNELLDHEADDSKFLVRSVDEVVRGVLGRSYRTDDSRPAMESLIMTAREVGAIMVDGYALDTRTSVKMILAKPIEIFPGEWAVVGLDYRNSDYGHGAREILGWIERLLCLNGASITQNFRRVHIGSQLEESAEFSAKTRKLNADFTASATRDMARALLGPEAVDRMVSTVRAANAAELDPDKALASIRKQVSKDEEKRIVE
jgi:hypothetical protein